MKNNHSLYLHGWGTVRITLSPAGITRIDLLGNLRGKPSSHPFIKAVKGYLEGRRKSLSLPIDIQTGTPFQQAVWRAIAGIPFGETRSYQWVAGRVRRPKAVRAVGRACGANPIPLLIPCHRVVKSGGKLGGFGAGLRWKRRLLALENAIK